MTIRKILTEPDPRLRNVAKAVTDFDEALRILTQDMCETMYTANLIGLAAPQIGVSLRVITVDVQYVETDRTDPLVLINPTFRDPEGLCTMTEGCGSLPGVGVKVERPEALTVDFQDVEAQTHTLRVDGLFARCTQHEVDHLDGILLVDYLSDLQKERALKKLMKLKRLEAEESKNSQKEPVVF